MPILVQTAPSARSDTCFSLAAWRQRVWTAFHWTRVTPAARTSSGSACARAAVGAANTAEIAKIKSRRAIDPPRPRSELSGGGSTVAIVPSAEHQWQVAEAE